MEYFARIVKSGQDINGHTIRRIYIYKPSEYRPNEYKYVPVDTLKNIHIGSIYKNGHYIRTQHESNYIIEQLQTVLGAENVCYIEE